MAEDKNMLQQEKLVARMFFFSDLFLEIEEYESMKDYKSIFTEEKENYWKDVKKRLQMSLQEEKMKSNLNLGISDEDSATDVEGFKFKSKNHGRNGFKIFCTKEEYDLLLSKKTKVKS